MTRHRSLLMSIKQVGETIGGFVSGVLIWPCVALVGFACIGWNSVYVTLIADAAPSGRIGRVSGKSASHLRRRRRDAAVARARRGSRRLALATVSMSAAVLARFGEPGLQSSDLMPRSSGEAT